MLSNIVEVGQVVEIQTLDHHETSELDVSKKVYRTKVFDILSEDQLEILMPMEKTKLILLPVDGEFNLCFYTKNGLYQCFAKVIDRYKSNNVYIVVMELTSNLRKFQRREFYRFSCALEMNSRKLELEEVMAVEKKKAFLVPGLPLKRSVIVDISGGGLRFIANHQYEVDSLIYCNYVLLTQKGPKEYHLVGKVIESSKVDMRENTYEHRVQYVNMNVDEREEIIRYIFEEERKSRHKETERKR